MVKKSKSTCKENQTAIADFTGVQNEATNHCIKKEDKEEKEESDGGVLTSVVASDLVSDESHASLGRVESSTEAEKAPADCNGNVYLKSDDEELLEPIAQ